MSKSGLIMAAIALVLAIGGTVVSPLCTPCLVLFLGAGAGYLAGVFDKPVEKSAATKSGALAGLIGGVGALLGQVGGSIINGVMVGPQGTAQLLRQMGLPSTGGDTVSIYWISLILSTVCFGLLDLALMAGTGALGGMLWHQINNKNATPPAPQ
ncbi:MAG: hypothetical protein AB1564_00685 [Chloroflexota bacterium]